MDVLTIVVVVWCVYVSDAIWWVASDTLLFTGIRPGELRARLGPSLDIRHGQGFFVSSLLPPFRCSFECALTAAGVDGRRPQRSEIERRIRRAIELSTPLRRLGEGLFYFLFILTPAVVSWRGLSATWMALIGSLILWLLVIAVAYRRAWVKLHGEGGGDWRGDAALMILSPPGAIRAGDRLTRQALRGMSGLSVLSAAASVDQFCSIARLLYFDEPTPRQEQIKKEIDGLLESEALTSAFDAPPSREPGMLGYCRRCHGQLLRGTGGCPDCPWLAITPFEATAGVTARV